MKQVTQPSHHQCYIRVHSRPFAVFRVKLAKALLDKNNSSRLLSEGEVVALIAEMERRKVIAFQGEKVRYSLPVAVGA